MREGDTYDAALGLRRRSNNSAYNDDEPASFLRDVTDYIARCQSVKPLRRQSLLEEFPWQGTQLLNISQSCCRSGLCQPLRINHKSFLACRELTPAPKHGGHSVIRSGSCLKDIQQLFMAAPYQMRMHRGISRGRFAEQEAGCQSGLRRTLTSWLAGETSGPKSELSPQSRQKQAYSRGTITLLAALSAPFMKPHTIPTGLRSET